MSFNGAFGMESNLIQTYEPKKICFQGGELIVEPEDFKEIRDVGFFKI